MKVSYTKFVTVDAKETDTIGKFKYLVAMLCGGTMENPEVYYRDYQIISADNDEEARNKYNELNNCSYFYGDVVVRLDTLNLFRE